MGFKGLKRVLFSPKLVRSIARAAIIPARTRYPRLISLELTNKCNAKCVMCPRDELSREYSHMKPELIEKFCADTEKNGLERLNLFWFGESLVRKDFPGILREISGRLKKTKINISTNGSMLRAENLDAILESNVHSLNIDIDGTTKETFEKVRIGLDFDEVEENARRFFARRAELGRKDIRTRVTMIKMDMTEHETAEFERRWKPLADKVVINQYSTWRGSVSDRNVGQSQTVSRDGRFDFPCKYPWDELIIGNTGICPICCLDYDCEEIVGDFNSQSITEIWRGEKMENIREKMISGKLTDIPVCSACNEYIFQRGSTWSLIWEKPGS